MNQPEEAQPKNHIKISDCIKATYDAIFVPLMLNVECLYFYNFIHLRLFYAMYELFHVEYVVVHIEY